MTTGSKNKETAIIVSKELIKKLSNKIFWMRGDDACEFLLGGHNPEDILFLGKLTKEGHLKYRIVKKCKWISYSSLEKTKKYLPLRLQRMAQRRETRGDSEGIIYLIHMGKTSFWKIGKSGEDSFESRLSVLQTGNPLKLRCSFRWKISAVMQDEINIHKLLNKYKTGGGSEWFQCERKILLDLLNQ